MSSGRQLRDVEIRSAQARDLPELVRMIRDFAEFERLSHVFGVTEDVLRDALFGQRPVAEAVIARVGAAAVGFAVFFPTFSTFAGRSGMYLEDLYVEPQWRRSGLGRMILARVARLAAERGCRQMNWSVLDWNEPALSFYRRLGAEPAKEWVGFRIDGEAFTRLASRTGD